MKTYTKYTEITAKEALRALADNNADPVDGFAFRDYEDKCWSPAQLVGVVLVNTDFPFRADGVRWPCCARVEEVNPRDVPEGVTPLPDDKPWLAYVGLEPDFFGKHDGNGVWFHSKFYGKGVWKPGFSTMGGGHIAIDVRTDFAKQHFPQIVEAMDYEERDSLKDIELWYWITPSAYLSDALKKAYELGRKNPEA